jgi:pectin methylesterase-like acyl-CoA thioesterase
MIARLIRMCLALLALLAFIGLAGAEPLVENFEGPFPPHGWQVFETGDGNQNWTRSINTDSVWGFGAMSRPDSGSTGLVSRQWLVTPRIGPEASGTTLHFYLRMTSPFSALGDTLYVLLTTSRPLPSAFTDTLATLLPGSDFASSFASFTLDLQSYVGTAIYIAFLHSAVMANPTTVILDSVSGPSLVIPPSPASNPSPASLASEVSVTVPLTWTNGAEVRTVDVYLSRNLADVTGILSTAQILSGIYADSCQPPSHLLSNQTYFWRVVSRNAWYQMAGPVWSFTTASGPLGGSYRIGGTDNEFATIEDAVGSLLSTGISAPTVFTIAPGIYSGPITLPPVPGTSASNTVNFQKGPGGSVTIQCGSATDTAAVMFAGANYVTLSGLDITAVSGTVRHCVVMTSASSHNVIRDAQLRGQSGSLTGSDAVMVYGSQCNDNRFENLTTRNVHRGFYLNGTPAVATANVIESCTADSVRCGIYLSRQDACLIHANDLSIDGGATDEVDGIYVGTTLPGDTISVSANKIHDVTTSSVYAVGIRVKPDSAMAGVRVYNNFIYGFRNTDGSQIRAIYVSSGQVELTANSILVNNVAATGATYAVYVGTTSSGGRTSLLNNILSNREVSALSYNVFLMLSSSPFTSDYNVFQGTGTAYRLGHLGTDMLSLVPWSTATGQDSHGLEGDPGFVSESDLHITSGDGLVSRNGLAIPYLTEDIDGESRHVPPDRGADEYFFSAQQLDVAVTDMPGLAASYVELSSVPISVVVQNRSSTLQTAIPVRLFYNNILQTESTLDLPALGIDTLVFSWTTPAAPSSGRLRAQCFLPGDINPANDSLSAPVRITRAPLIGNYTIGDSGSDYSSFLDAVNDLQTRGVAGNVVFDVQPGVYPEQVTINPYPGQSASHAVAFHSAQGPQAIRLSSNLGPATVVLNGTRFLTFDGIDIEALAPNFVGFQLSQGADSNTLSRSHLTGPSLLATTACGVQTTGGSNDGNILTDLTVSGFYSGIRLEGTEANPDQENIIQNCVILSSHTAVGTAYQDSTILRANTIHTGYPGANTLCYGVSLGAQASGQTIILDANTLSGHEGSAGLCAIYSNTSLGIADITNNMISGWNAYGLAAAYGILVGGGHADLQFNSLWMNDIPGTGDIIAVADTGASTTVIAQNNVIEISETSNNAWCILRANGSLSSNYNAVSNRTGGNSHFRVARSGTTDYGTLSAWQTATGMDSHSLSGNPGFVDSLNLHILPSYDLLDDRGVADPSVATDFDGQVRANPPCIGADEYVYSIPARDFAVRWLQTPAPQYPAAQSFDIGVIVTNAGAESQQNVPVRLFFGQTLLDDTVLTLNAGVADTITLHWLTPDVGLTTATLKAQCFLYRDAVPENDNATAEVTVTGAPLAGNYNLGGANANFATFAEAVHHLTARGVSSPVMIAVQPGAYSEAVRLTGIPGADSLNRVTFAGTESDTVVTLTSALGEAVLLLDSADFVEFNRLSIVAIASCTTAVELTHGASHNVFRNCLIRGADSLNSATIGAMVHADGNTDNLFDGVTVSGAFTGIEFEGDAAFAQCHDNRIVSSVIRNARYGVYVERQIDCVIHGCEIIPGSRAPIAAACYGVYIASLGNGGSAEVSANRIHGFADGSSSSSNRAVGVYAAGASGGTVKVWNNFIYDFSNAGNLKVNAIYLSAGENSVLHNSVLIGDVPMTGDIAAVYISTGSNHTIQNNIFVSLEDDVPSYGILLSAGTYPICNGNDIYGFSPLFAIGKLGITTYGTLAAWQAAGFDANGISAAPGFISASDLHIADTLAVVNARGVQTVVTTDIDGDARGNPPDIGADEYAMQPGEVNRLVIYSVSDSVRLIWHSAARATGYRVYGSHNFDVQPGSDDFLTEVSDTTFTEAITDEAAGLRFYVVTAVTDDEFRSQNAMKPKSQNWGQNRAK